MLVVEKIKKIPVEKKKSIFMVLISNPRLLGVTLDYTLNFDPHISNFCRREATQYNVLKRLRSFLSFKENEVLVQSIEYFKFSSCPLVWYFSTEKSLQKVEKLKERALRFLYLKLDLP